MALVLQTPGIREPETTQPNQPKQTQDQSLQALFYSLGSPGCGFNWLSSGP